MRAIRWGTQIASGLLVLSVGLPASAQDLTSASGSGPYMRSQMLAFVRPFEETTGNEVNVEFYNGGLEEVRRQVRSANVKWDVVDFLEEDLIQACEEGLLDPIDPRDPDPDRDWQSWWTIFYCGWWVAWCPFFTLVSPDLRQALRAGRR